MKEQITKKEVWDYLVSLESHELHFFSASRLSPKLTINITILRSDVVQNGSISIARSNAIIASFGLLFFQCKIYARN